MLVVISLLLTLALHTAQTPIACPAPVVATDLGAPLQVVVGETVALALPTQAGTGYSWSLVTPPDPAVLESVGDTSVSAPPIRPGAPQAQCFVFVALAPGDTSMQFAYARPFEPDAEPARTQDVEVLVAPSQRGK